MVAFPDPESTNGPLRASIPLTQQNRRKPETRRKAGLLLSTDCVTNALKSCNATVTLFSPICGTMSLDEGITVDIGGFEMRAMVSVGTGLNFREREVTIQARDKMTPTTARGFASVAFGNPIGCTVVGGGKVYRIGRSRTRLLYARGE